jgi:hypothetical protein
MDHRNRIISFPCDVEIIWKLAVVSQDQLLHSGSGPRNRSDDSLIGRSERELTADDLSRNTSRYPAGQGICMASDILRMNPVGFDMSVPLALLKTEQ